MAKEAIQAVRDAENRAHQLIEEAKEKGEQEIQEKTEFAEREYKRIRKEAMDQVELWKREATEKGESLAAPKLAEAQEQAQRYLNLTEEDLKKAVELVVERVTHYGDR
jgi:vacuolar-type H+-ATPase subunit H